MVPKTVGFLDSPLVAGRTLTERELNKALLARQLLLEPATLPLPRAVERMGGIQAQYAPSAYVGLFSRVAGFERSQLTRALQRRSVVQATLMRATIHIVSRADFWPLAAAVREPTRDWWVRAAGRTGDPRRAEAAARSLRQMLAAGPRTRADLAVELGLDSATWNGVGMYVDLVRVPPSGTWERRRADLYDLAENWLGPSSISSEDGLRLLIRRYLGGFGPASRKDIQSFTGLPMAILTPAIDQMHLRRFRDESGGELLDLPRAPLPDADTPAPVRFLGTWDATLLVHARRTQVLPERLRPLVFNTKTPHSVPTFLVDGQVAGSWRHDDKGLSWEAFEPLPAAARRAVESEADRLAAFHS